ncbi:hypothetical protein ACFY84_33695 [Streptomyces sp. NPDC012438]
MRPEGSVRIAALHGEIDYDELDLLREALCCPKASQCRRSWPT